MFPRFAPASIQPTMPVLSFTLSEDAVSVLRDTLICLNKFSDDVSFEAQNDKVRLSTLLLRVSSERKNMRERESEREGERVEMTWTSRGYKQALNANGVLAKNQVV